MQVFELLKLIDWFKSNIIDEGIITKYSKFSEKLTHNSNSGNNQPKQAYKAERQVLIEALEKINFNTLSIEQIDYLKKLSIAELFGEHGKRKIEQVLFENNLDIATAAKEISEYSKKLSQAQLTMNKINDALSQSFSIHENNEIPDDSILMRIYFQQESSISNMADFKKIGANWYDISRGIAMAIDKTPEDFIIIGASKGSIILDLLVATGIATTISKILLEGLKVADRTLDILKKSEEIKALKLNNRKIEEELKEEAKIAKDEGINIILIETVNQIGLTDGQGDIKNALEASITKLVEFTQNGGQVDFVQPEPKTDGVDVTSEIKSIDRVEMDKLRENIAEIRKLESKIKLLNAGGKIN